MIDPHRIWRSHKTWAPLCPPHSVHPFCPPNLGLFGDRIASISHLFFSGCHGGETCTTKSLQIDRGVLFFVYMFEDVWSISLNCMNFIRIWFSLTKFPMNSLPVFRLPCFVCRLPGRSVDQSMPGSQRGLKRIGLLVKVGFSSGWVVFRLSPTGQQRTLENEQWCWLDESWIIIPSTSFYILLHPSTIYSQPTWTSSCSNLKERPLGNPTLRVAGARRWGWPVDPGLEKQHQAPWISCEFRLVVKTKNLWIHVNELDQWFLKTMLDQK